jgi:hypothetical protein
MLKDLDRDNLDKVVKKWSEKIAHHPNFIPSLISELKKEKKFLALTTVYSISKY